jgi:hypothetical protein
VHLCNPVLGLMRLDALHQTALHGAYVSADHVLLPPRNSRCRDRGSRLQSLCS